ncbi:MAG: hypothetical protein CL612_04730 [Anaerolineaceae bacterium]|jgi:surfeit locus 1 family protein|nr:hypothetical protein [Anaerolineaceae bacterium]|tara:strand:- start:47 stop:814 length:768 start_codon:yes stop_codon:yes gene_type:complete
MLSWNKVPMVLIGRNWWWRTVMVLCAMGVMGRLGIWQLERHFQRRTRNEFVSRQLSLESVPIDTLDLQDDLDNVDLRAVTLMGEYDYENDFILKGQVLRGRSGVNLITPLMLYDSNKAILVNRGWVPHEILEFGDMSVFQEYGTVTVSGRIRKSQDRPGDSLTFDGFYREIYQLDIDDLQRYVDYTLMPVYVQEDLANNSFDDLPQSVPLEFELDDGPHLGYAVQWWLFVPLLGWVYLHLLRTNEGARITDIIEE